MTKTCKECDCCRKGYFKSKPNAYVCIGVKNPFVIADINKPCTEYGEPKRRMSMTESEAKEYVVDECRATRCKYSVGNNKCVEDGQCFEVKQTVIQALEEVQAYRAIGTIEEFKALKEKAEPKKPIEKIEHHEVVSECPVCHTELYKDQKYCDDCGTAIDWE